MDCAVADSSETLEYELPRFTSSSLRLSAPEIKRDGTVKAMLKKYQGMLMNALSHRKHMNTYYITLYTLRIRVIHSSINRGRCVSACACACVLKLISNI